MWGGDPARFNFVRTVLLGWANDVRRDLGFCTRQGRLREWPHALKIRWRQRQARLAGFRAGWKEFRVAAGTVSPPMWSRWGSPAATPPAA
jgi:rhamnosyltransferase